MALNRVYISRVGIPTVETVAEEIRNALQWLEWHSIVRPTDRVFVKPNLTWYEPLPGVTVTPAFLEALASVLRERTMDVTFVESNGGYHSFQAEEAFQSHGLYRIREKYGIKILNLSSLPAERVSVDMRGKPVTVELPRPLLEADVFITVPVPKIHAMTRVSLAFKNQWGCQPDPMRLRAHPEFDVRVVAINKLCRPRIAIYDGTFFLDENGPMAGRPIPMNLVIAANDIGAGDLVCCKIMKIDPMRVRHFRVAHEEGMFPWTLDGILVNQDWQVFSEHQFRLRRTLLNWFGLLAFNSKTVLKVTHDSALGDSLHKVLYSVRRNRLMARLLYGRFGFRESLSATENPGKRHSC